MAARNGILTQLNDLWLKAAPGANKRDVGSVSTTSSESRASR